MIVFDIETNGLLNDLTKIHCVVLHNTEDNQTFVYNDEGADKEPIIRAITMLDDAKQIVGHNIINYDIPAIKKLYGFFEPQGEVIDTLLLSRLYHPNMIAVDKKHGWKHMPLQLYGRHSLESYGHRLGEFKGSFGKTANWAEWSQEMEDYCRQDVKVTCKLVKHFQKRLE